MTNYFDYPLESDSVTPQHAKKLAKALNDNINRFEKNFGSIKDYDNPKFQLNFGPTGKA